MSTFALRVFLFLLLFCNNSFSQLPPLCTKIYKGAQKPQRTIRSFDELLIVLFDNGYSGHFYFENGNPRHSFRATVVLKDRTVEAISISQTHTLEPQSFSGARAVDRKVFADMIDLWGEKLIRPNYGRRKFGQLTNQFIENMRDFEFSDILLVHSVKSRRFIGSSRLVKAPYLVIYKEGKNLVLPWPTLSGPSRELRWTDFNKPFHKLPVELFFNHQLERGKFGYYADKIVIEGKHYPYHIGFASELSSFSISKISSPLVQQAINGHKYYGYDQQGHYIQRFTREALFYMLVDSFYRPNFLVKDLDQHPRQMISSLMTQILHSPNKDHVFAYGDREGVVFFRRHIGFTPDPSVSKMTDGGLWTLLRSGSHVLSHIAGKLELGDYDPLSFVEAGQNIEPTSGQNRDFLGHKHFRNEELDEPFLYSDRRELIHEWMGIFSRKAIIELSQLTPPDLISRFQQRERELMSR